MNSVKITICIIFYLINITVSIAQDTLTSVNVEQKSYELYENKKWNELIIFGNQAIAKGFDYYFLRLRIGIAYYEKENYSLALPHFEKAYYYNSGDDLILEYIYYCYLFNGRYENARRLSRIFSATLAHKIGTDTQSVVSFIIIEGGTKKTDSLNYYNKDLKNNSNYFNSPVYLHFGINHYVKNKFSLFHALTYFNQKTFIDKIGQTQYYIKNSIPMKNNWIISPSIHLVHVKNTSDIPIIPPSTMPGGQSPRPRLNTIVKNSNYIVSSCALQKTIKRKTIGIGATVSNMNNVNQIIHSVNFLYSVFGNNKLIIGGTAYIHTTNSYNSMNTALSPFIYVQAKNNISLKLNYLVNTKNNIIEENGYLVNNSADLTKSRYSALLNINLNQHIDIYSLYQLEFKREEKQLFNYRYNVIVAGVKIKP